MFGCDSKRAFYRMSEAAVRDRASFPDPLENALSGSLIPVHTSTARGTCQ